MSEKDAYLNNLILSPTTPVTTNPVTPSLFATKPVILTMIDQASGQACEGTEEVDWSKDSDMLVGEHMLCGWAQ